MSAGTNIRRDVSGEEQFIQELYSALRGGPPVANAQGDPTNEAVDLGSATNAWRRLYAREIVLGGVTFSPTALARNTNAMRAEYDYVWNQVTPDNLDQDAVIWLDGSTPGEHDIASMTDALDFRLLLLTTGRDTTDRWIAGTNAQRVRPPLTDSGAPRYTDVDDHEFWGSWRRFHATNPRTWTDLDITMYANDRLVHPNLTWRRLTRAAGQSMVVTLGEEGARGTLSNPGATETKITIGGVDIWQIARTDGSAPTLNGAVSGPVNGACLLVPLF